MFLFFFFSFFFFSFHASDCRGTHGYMAPEVLSKGTAYDSSADWFSFGCMLYKLLKGHSPFRQHKTKDKHEIDRMTLTMVSSLPHHRQYHHHYHQHHGTPNKRYIHSSNPCFFFSQPLLSSLSLTLLSFSRSVRLFLRDGARG